MKIFPLKKVIPAAVTRGKIEGKGKLTEEQYVTEIAGSAPVSNLGGWYQAIEKKVQIIAKTG